MKTTTETEQRNSRSLDRRVRDWSRSLWAVEMRSASCRPDPILIGEAWHHLNPPAYEGEPPRCLLFRTRKQARAWCAEATIHHAKHSNDWRFKPVRVRETISPNQQVSHGGDE